MSGQLKKGVIFFVFFFCFHVCGIAGTVASALSDSLLNIIKVSNEDTLRVNVLNQLSDQYMMSAEYDKALEYAQSALRLSEKLAYNEGKAISARTIGNVFWYLGNFDKALENYFQSFSVWEKLGDKKGIADAFTSIGIAYIMQGNYEKALDVQLKALKIKEELNDKRGLANTYNSLGVIYWKMGNFDLALSQYLNCLTLWEELGEKKGISAAYNNIGIIYNLKSDYEKALDAYLKALRLAEEMSDKKGIAQTYNNIGSIYIDWGNIFVEEGSMGNALLQFKKALGSHLKSLAIRVEIKDRHGEAMSHNNIGGVYVKMNRLDSALVHLKLSLSIYSDLGDKDGVKDSYASLADLYSKMKNYEKAYEFHVLYSGLKDSILNEESAKQIAEMNIKYDSEKKDKELIKKDAEINKQQLEAERKNLQRNAFIAGFISVLALVFFILRSYNQKKAANLQLEEKNDLIEKQKKLVEDRNMKITDSITYAKRIQYATLPSEADIKSVFPDSFIIFRPKDIVSGDFYWHSRIMHPNHEGSETPGTNTFDLIVVADCTGHGVPGAFMSMIGNTLLNEIVNVKKIYSPALILSELNKGVIGLLNQGSSTSETQDDGMDITLLKVNHRLQELEYASANHFSYVVMNDRVEQLEGDIHSIGGLMGNPNLRFSSQSIKFEKGTTVYLFTDGLIDQFGGEKNSKYTSARFKLLIKDIQAFSLNEQQERIVAAFENWKGSNAQLDDVLVIGIKV
jgi:tetratricopeptide (TPR) repeat protein